MFLSQEQADCQVGQRGIEVKWLQLSRSRLPGGISVLGYPVSAFSSSLIPLFDSDSKQKVPPQNELALF